MEYEVLTCEIASRIRIYHCTSGMRNYSDEEVTNYVEEYLRKESTELSDFRVANVHWTDSYFDVSVVETKKG